MISVAVSIQRIKQSQAQFFNEGTIAIVLLKYWVNQDGGQAVKIGQ